MQWIGVGIMVVSIIIAIFSYSKDSGAEVSEEEVFMDHFYINIETD